MGGEEGAQGERHSLHLNNFLTTPSQTQQGLTFEEELWKVLGSMLGKK